MEYNLRKSIIDDLNKYDPIGKKDDWIEVVEWANGDGIDVTIDSCNERIQVSLSWGELSAIQHLANEIQYTKEFDK